MTDWRGMVLASDDPAWAGGSPAPKGSQQVELSDRGSITEITVRGRAEHDLVVHWYTNGGTNVDDGTFIIRVEFTPL